ncbi:MAG: D-tyrosyl-tRNA(Tyr) deacylase [Bacteroidetes bacterium]|jgi:D-tyrosyl-tRNA(Tyr) deacylase|nr:D-tyrosyl-tRNA(Tyr) deacylase [Bacteroidota bacterium]
MKIVIQRVSRASVTVQDQVTGSIEEGLALLVGIHESDTKEEADWCCRKIPKLRLFEDDDGKMNRSVKDVEGGILVVSQFTLYGDARKGNRPSFIEAARPEKAEPLYDYIIEKLKESGVKVESGVFGAMMDVNIVNNGPVTLILER